MKQVTLNIPDSKYGFFIELMKNLNFMDNLIETIEIPEEHKEIVRKRMNRSKANPEILLDWDEVQNKFKLG